MPYPNVGMAEWCYAERFKDRDAYLKKMLPQRSELLRATLAAGHFELVVAYGAAYWPQYRYLFEGVSWNDVGGMHRGSMGATRILLTHHFSGRSFNSEAQLDRFADAALNYARA
jgi:hypothetical protein